MGLLGSILTQALRKVAGEALGKAVENVINPNAGNPKASSSSLREKAEVAMFDVEIERRKLAAQAASERVITPTSAADIAVLEQFKQLLPQYPVWSVGGRDFQIEKDSELRQGKPIYHFSLSGGPELLDGYCLVLERNGFTKLNKDTFSDLYYKVIDGLCYCFSCTDSCQDGGIWVSFCVDNSFCKE